MFSEYLCHGWKPEPRLYYCCIKIELLCHWVSCDSAFIKLMHCYSSLALASSSVISHSSCYPVTYQPLKNGRQGQEGL